MTFDVKVVGVINFGNKKLDAYSSLDIPLFRAIDIADLIDYSQGNTWKLLELCEADEKVNISINGTGQRRMTSFVTELGLYNILAQSKKPLARKWRRVVHQQLIDWRNAHDKDIVGMFDDWDRISDTLFVDPDTGEMMQSVTVQGGDVIQVPYREES
jgi:hypothetical protein